MTAALGIGMEIDMLATMPFISIGMAATTIASQNLGASKIDLVFQTLRISVYSGLFVALVCTAVLLIVPDCIGVIFLKESVEKVKVLNIVRNYYHWMAFTFLCFAVGLK